MASADLDLVGGPRGRRWLLEFAYAFCPPGVGRPTWSVSREEVLELVRQVLESTDVEALARSDESAVLIAFGEAVGFARYWQEPDLDDEVLASDPLRKALQEVAATAGASPGFQTLRTSIKLDGQAETATRSTGQPTFTLQTPASSALERWRLHVQEDEARAARDRPEDLTAPWSGEWWSKPWVGGSTIVETCRRSSDGVPIRFRLEEDDYGLDRVLARDRTVPPDAVVLELRRPDDWRALVERWPLEVTASRRHDWWRATGQATRWFMPDFAAAAAEYDAIHLTMAAYLSTAGRPLPVEGGQTLLAGRDPDATFWLTDLAAPDPQQEQWVRDPEDYWAWRIT